MRRWASPEGPRAEAAAPRPPTAEGAAAARDTRRQLATGPATLLKGFPATRPATGCRRATRSMACTLATECLGTACIPAASAMASSRHRAAGAEQLLQLQPQPQPRPPRRQGQAEVAWHRGVAAALTRQPAVSAANGAGGAQE